MSQTIAPVLGEATVQELREALRGEILTASDEGYIEAARIWNGAHDGRRPALIARCTGVADVIAAVGFARSQRPHDRRARRRPQHRGLLDVRRRDRDRPLADERRSRRPGYPPRDVGGGAVWADVDHETQANGLATTGGLVSSTGVGGFTLGGGIGWLMRKHGLACDNLVGSRRRHRRRPPRPRDRGRERGLALGPSRRRRQLRHRHAVRAATASGRADGLRRPDLLPGRRRPRPAAGVPRVVGRRARRDHRARRPHYRTAAAGDPGGVARQEGGGVPRRLRRSARSGRRAGDGTSARSPSRSPTCSARCRTT